MSKEMTKFEKAFAFVLLSLRSGDPWVAHLNGVELAKRAREESLPSWPGGADWDEHIANARGLKAGEQARAEPQLGCGCRTGCCPHSCTAHWTPDGKRRAG